MTVLLILWFLRKLPAWIVTLLLRMPFPPFQWPYFAAAVAKTWRDLEKPVSQTVCMFQIPQGDGRQGETA